jgi:protein phosphatase 1G
MITALPDIQSIDLEEGDDFFVLACDGIWNSKNNQQVIDFVRPRLAESKTLSQICEEVRIVVTWA